MQPTATMDQDNRRQLLFWLSRKEKVGQEFPRADLMVDDIPVSFDGCRKRRCPLIADQRPIHWDIRFDSIALHGLRIKSAEGADV